MRCPLLHHGSPDVATNDQSDAEKSYLSGYADLKTKVQQTRFLFDIQTGHTQPFSKAARNLQDETKLNIDL